MGSRSTSHLRADITNPQGRVRQLEPHAALHVGIIEALRLCERELRAIAAHCPDVTARFDPDLGTCTCASNSECADRRCVSNPEIRSGIPTTCSRHVGEVHTALIPSGRRGGRQDSPEATGLAGERRTVPRTVAVVRCQRGLNAIYRRQHRPATCV